jgi:hypothetical protein
MKVGLDVDGILANFTQHIIDTANAMGIGQHFPRRWQFCNKWMFSDHFDEVWSSIKDDPMWWLSIPPHEGVGHEIDFEIEAYVTARPIGPEFTAAWLQHHGFQKASVLTVQPDTSKVEALEHLSIDLFVDDRGDNFAEILAGGIQCLLYDRPWNRDCADGGLRIKSLKEVRGYMEKEAS